MITRVYGSCNEFAIEFQRREGSDLEIWDAIVPADKDGQYVIEVYAESSGGLTAYAATVLFLISGHEIAGKLVPRGYTAESENIEYSSLLNLNQLTAEIVKQCFSGHKIYGPTGVGVLYGKEEWLDKLPPYQGGGEMIQSVSFEKTTFNELPFKFEAGTPDYIGTTALAKALDYVSALGVENVATHEHELTQYAMQRLKEIDGMRIFGEAGNKSSVISFLVGNIHHLDMGTLLDRLGIAVRTGHHCAQPLMIRMGIEGTVRASFGLYNTKEEIDVLAAGIERVSRMF